MSSPSIVLLLSEERQYLKIAEDLRTFFSKNVILSLVLERFKIVKLLLIPSLWSCRNI
jgi:hypothetical protein